MYLCEYLTSNHAMKVEKIKELIQSCNYNRKNEMFHFCKTKCSKKHTPIHLIPYQKNTNFQAFSKTVTINK